MVMSVAGSILQASRCLPGEFDTRLVQDFQRNMFLAY